MFDEKLKYYLNLVETNLEKYLPVFKHDYGRFDESLKYSLLDGGKRLRPVLTLAVCDMLEGNLNSAVSFACGVEFIHAGSLIHDDLPCMDNSSVRRNKPSCHAKFGETIAVLAGDGLFLTAFKILTDAKNFGVTDKDIVKACYFLSQMSGLDGMVLGQVIDMFAESKNCDEKVLEVLVKLKTASLIRAACVLGAIAAKVDDETEEKINSYAEFLGIAFQICDDILDFKETSNIDNKNKLNYINILGIEKARQQAQFYTQKALDKIKEFKNNEFLIYLTNLMLNRIN